MPDFTESSALFPNHNRPDIAVPAVHLGAKATSFFSRMLAIKPKSAATPLSVASGSEDCSSSMPAPHEFFDHTGIRLLNPISISNGMRGLAFEPPSIRASPQGTKASRSPTSFNT